MFDPTTASAADLLAVPLDEPEQVFGSPDHLSACYIQLAKRWHPDHGGREDVIKHLNMLRERANKKIDAGSWHVPGLLEIRGNDGKLRRIRYHKKFDFPLGVAYMGESLITYVIRDDFADLAEIARSIMSGFRFENDKMRAMMGLRLPKLKSAFAAADTAVLVVEKTSDLIRLRDVVAYMGGRLDPKHVAWITSELLNFTCYLEWAKLTHNDISLDTVFICPARHTACVLGGWWHATPVGGKLTIPKRTFGVLPGEVLAAKTGHTRSDLETIRLTGRETLGDEHGTRLASFGVPKPICDWVRLPSPSSARDDYRHWQTVLKDAFGDRRFVSLTIESSTIYHKEKP